MPNDAVVKVFDANQGGLVDVEEVEHDNKRSMVKIY
jgi:hypothetical protein